MENVRTDRPGAAGNAGSKTVIPVEHRNDDDHGIRDVGLVSAYRGDMFRSRVSWGAIFAGTLIGLGVMLLLSLLGMSIGFSAMNFGEQGGAFSGIPTGAAIWLAVSQLIALGVGGFVAGRLAAIPKVTSSALHGTAVWALASLLLLYTATSAIGSVVGGATSMVSSVASGAGSIMSQVAPSAMPGTDTQRQIQSEASGMINNVLSQREQSQASTAVRSAAADIARDPSSAQAEIQQMVDQLFGRGGVIGPDDRRQAVAVLARRTGMSQPEAEATINRWQAQVTSMAQTTSKQAQVAANNTADGLAKTALWAFIGSLVGLVAAAGCAVLGRTGQEEALA
jgi:hypothetical protein